MDHDLDKDDVLATCGSDIREHNQRDRNIRNGMYEIRKYVDGVYETEYTKKNVNGTYENGIYETEYTKTENT